MSTLFQTRWLATAVMATAFLTMHPGTLSAQNSGVAGDGTMRLMWRGTDSSVSLWKLDSSGAINYLSSRAYGPYYGYRPIALTTAGNGNSYLVWQHTNGSISLWVLNSNNDYVTSRAYGPYNGWLVDSVSVETPGSNRFRIIWRDTNGSVSIWIVDGGLNLVASRAHGPYWGWTPSSLSSSKASAQAASERTVDPLADAAMATPPSIASRMPEQEQ